MSAYNIQPRSGHRSSAPSGSSNELSQTRPPPSYTLK